MLTWQVSQRAQVAGLEKETQALKAVWEESNRARAEAQSKLGDLQRKGAQYHSQLSQVQQQLANEQAALSQLKGQLVTQSGAMQQKQGEMQRAQGEINSLKDRQAALAKEVGTCAACCSPILSALTPCVLRSWSSTTRKWTLRLVR